ncbi:hypothetical protein [Streptomyces alanosinicus]|uniref:DUF3325 domain-containing protein n=1 Tax=Streptomyces alanosinicus TaxID=68171 RepID=A0A918YN31_9ACTN|nr:hypothetical protein [Streptomyces alanosinicus]GHE10358.1 hypothetical protein GCM10010339_66220 [Streptomyces alanosinicus]
MLINAIATAVLLAELGVIVRYRLVRRRRERPGDWPQPTDVRYSHLAAALAAAIIGWALAGADTAWGTLTTVLFLGVFIPASAALAATALWRPVTGWIVCATGGLATGLATL